MLNLQYFCQEKNKIWSGQVREEPVKIQGILFLTEGGRPEQTRSLKWCFSCKECLKIIFQVNAET